MPQLRRVRLMRQRDAAHRADLTRAALQVGEAFRPLVPPRLVHVSYATAGGNVLTDAAWRAAATSRTAGGTSAAAEAIDTLLWQAQSTTHHH